MGSRVDAKRIAGHAVIPRRGGRRVEAATYIATARLPRAARAATAPRAFQALAIPKICARLLFDIVSCPVFFAYNHISS